MNLVIRKREASFPGSQEVEVVERKGLGHPDTICDAIAEQMCVHLCRYYLQHFGRILHHNVDKVLLVGGSSCPSFDGGKITAPIEIYLAGRATQEYLGEQIPIHEIAVKACREWLQRNLPRLNVESDVKIISRLRPGSADLTRLFDKDGVTPLANDTSCGVGFAPFTDLERVVLEVERCLNSSETKRIRPEIGEDIKVMGVRRGARIDLTIGCAFVSRFIHNAGDYLSKKNGVQELVLETAGKITKLNIEATVNAADAAEKESFFLTVTGTSAESGDDGEVGRGNRTNGLITPYRLMTLEAAVGKNPVSHVGKLYNILAGRIAAGIAEKIPHITNAECVLVSQIGRPVSDPKIVDILLTFGDHTNIKNIERPVAEITQYALEQLLELRDDLLNERIAVY